MESHILNTYHQARYRIHRLNRTSTSESYSSESSCNQNSPEYPAKGFEGDEWKGKQNGSTNGACKVEEDSSDSSSDYDEVPEAVQPKHEPTDAYDQAQSSELAHEEYYGEEMMVGDSDDDYEIVVDDEAPGTDGPIIQVYAVHPDLDLEGSEDEQDYAIPEEEVHDEDGDLYVVEEADNREGTVRERHDSLGINLDVPVVSNVDEYFIKEKKIDEAILEVKDQPVVADVDEYFIKDNGNGNSESLEEAEDLPQLPNVDEFFIKNHKVVEPEPVILDAVEPVSNVEEFFDKGPHGPVTVKVQVEEETKEVESEEATDASILPHIEHIKRFLLEDMPCPKLQTKSMQRSCSLPHSPAHFSYLDACDAKTSLSFEDLNLDLSDFTFDEGRPVKNIEMPLEEDANNSDDNPRTLTEEDVNSFLITSKPGSEKAPEEPIDDLSQEDMEIDVPLESKIDVSDLVVTKPIVSEVPAPKASTVLDFCIEKPATEVKAKKVEPKVEVDDFVDVESLNDTVIPVLEATNVGALLEQFEATEKFNTNVKKKLPIKIEAAAKTKVGNGLPSGVRLQDAAAQLNKNKMRHILMSTPTSNSSVKKTSQTVHSDHDYCSPKKRHSLPAPLKGGQSLLKPEVLSSNNKILSSRHRSCKNKKVVYHLSSDDDDSNGGAKDKTSVKPSAKAPLLSNHRKKLSPIPSVANVSCKEKGNVSVMSNNASKASDNCSQSSSGSIKLTIKNKSKVILKIESDDKKDSQKITKNNDSVKSSVSKVVEDESKPMKQDSNAKLLVSDEKIQNDKAKSECAVIKEESGQSKEDFYTALFKNKRDIHIALPEPTIVKPETKTIESNENKQPNDATFTPNVETKPLKKKLNLQEYKLRREGANSNGSSRTVSPEAIFPDIPIPLIFDKATNSIKTQQAQSEVTAAKVTPEIEGPKLFDPIRDASRKILANTKKQKAEATRKRDEDIVMSKIPKVDNLQLQPLISDAEMLKIVGMAPADVAPLVEKPKSNTDYEELVLVSVGTNTDEAIFKMLNKHEEKRKPKSPTHDKSLINFRIKKSENVLKQNVFDPVKNDAKSPSKDRNVSPNTEAKIDKERYKDITATLKSVGKQVDKRCSNSLFASIQDVVMKKAPDQQQQKPEERKPSRKSSSTVEKKSFFKSNSIKTAIVRHYDSKTEHGEDKIILHLEKNRPKPSATSMDVQTDPSDDFDDLSTFEPDPEPADVKVRPPKCIRKRTVSDMSVSSEESPARKDKAAEKKLDKRKSEDSKSVDRHSRSRDRCSRSRSKSRYRSKYSRSYRKRTRSRSRSRSRCRSRSLDRYRPYRRSPSPYRRSPYRSSMPRSRRRDYRHRSRSRNYRSRSRSPVAKKGKQTPDCDKKELTPRKPTVSESSDTSSSSSSSSSRASRSRSRSRSLKSRRSTSRSRSVKSRRSNSRSRSVKSRRSNSRSRSLKRRSASRVGRRAYSSYSVEARDGTPVEERRIVFVGKLEKDVGKSTLRGLFGKFGPILEVTLHSKEDGCRYGFVTFQRARDAWSAVEAAKTFPNYDVGFGGRRAFCRQRYADLDGLEADYSEGYLGPPPAAVRQDMSFEQMLQDMKHKLSQRKTDKRDEKP